MLRELIDHSPDLKRLFEEGFQLEWIGGHLVVRHIPYVTIEKKVKYGVLITNLRVSNSRADFDNNHQIYFIGEAPCHADGTPIEALSLNAMSMDLGNGLIANFHFSNKPSTGYVDYYHKISRYVEILEHQALAIDGSVIARPHLPLKDDSPDSVFQYFDYNSSRAGINAANQKLAKQKIGIIGLGGSGSYILDFVSKTQVAEIHLFDADVFMTHNAFRAPGAASLEDLNEELKKVDYHARKYSTMHKHIIPHAEYITSDNIHLLNDLSFAFLSMDSSEVKETIIFYLIVHGIPFVDVGMAVIKVNDQLLGQVRTTLVTPQQNDHWRERISTSRADQDEYATNIQVAELNASNAVQAVLMWKKYFGFYQDLTHDFNSVFDINTGTINNEDQTSICRVYPLSA
ncbi:MAG: ThiF family adenylyltransferase [Flavobacteriales bacterium]